MTHSREGHFRQSRQCLILLLVLFVLPLQVNSQATKAQLQDQMKELLAKTKQQPGDATSWFTLGRVEHDLTNSFGATLGADAVASLAAADKLRPDAVTKAYLGSAWTLVARDAASPIDKIDGVLKGCELLDTAVKLEPDNLTVRRIRYENNMALPDIFERQSFVTADVDYLLKTYATNPQAFKGLYDPAHVFLTKARLLSWANDWTRAKQYAELGKKIASDPQVKQQIQDFLDGKDVKK